MSHVFAFLKIWDIFASSLLWSHENITSPLRTWGLLYMINNITTEKTLSFLWFCLQRKTFVIHDNKMRTIDWNCSVVPCVTQVTFSMSGWSNPSQCLIHTPAFILWPWPSSALKVSGCPQKNKHAVTSCAALSSHMSSRRAKGLRHFPFLPHLTLQSCCSLRVV